jgi:hypothetical protein
MDAGLAVVGGADGLSLRDELLAQLDVVDHIAVVSPHHVTVGIEMGLRIDLRGSAESGPAQLDNAPRADHLRKSKPPRDLIYLPHVLAQIDGAVVSERGAAYGIVAPIREPTPGLGQDLTQASFVFHNDAKDTTHCLGPVSSFQCCAVQCPKSTVGHRSTRVLGCTDRYSTVTLFARLRG